MVLAILVGAVFWYRKYRPLVALGIALFLGCHLLTGTILPLELVYEHRNYFASFGLLLAIVPLLAAPADHAASRLSLCPAALHRARRTVCLVDRSDRLYRLRMAQPGESAQELAIRAPTSPRAQYELGRTYLIYSHYDPDSPYTKLVYAPLERAAALPDSSILPQQALIFFNARMHRPIMDAWWDSLIASLKRRKPGVQDESSLAALTQCAREQLCRLPADRMQQAFEAAVSHPDTDARLWANYGDYAWNVLGHHEKGLLLTQRAVATAPKEPAYHITLTRMYIVLGEYGKAGQQIYELQQLDIGGELDGSIAELRHHLDRARGRATMPTQAVR